MGAMSIWHWLIVGAVVLIFFSGRGKISDAMGDVAKGIKAFKKGMADDETPKPVEPVQGTKPIEHQQMPETTASSAETTEKKNNS